MTTIEPTVPPAVRLAARRAFIRTTAQAYATSLATGLPPAAVIAAVLQDSTGWLIAGLTVALALVSPLAAGLVSYLQWIAKGVPDDYVPAAVNTVFRTRREARNER